MFLLGLVATFVCVLVGVYTVKSVKKIVVITKVLQFIGVSGIAVFMRKIGMSERMRPKLRNVMTSPNGTRVVMSNEITRTVLPEASRLKIRGDDVFLVTYPKAGTTWLQEITWLICNKANIQEAKQTSVTVRVPYMEMVDASADIKGFQTIKNWPKNDKQRIIKTHATFDFLPDEIKDGGKCKIVYLARNPKDLCVSYYHFYLMCSLFPHPGKWAQFLTDFSRANVDWGSWFSHVLEYWKKYQDGDSRMHFVTYEDLRKDLKSGVSKLAKFLEKNLTEEQLDTIVDHCSFESMSKNDKVNYSVVATTAMNFTISKFMRKGEVGDWKNYFTINQNAAFDALYEDKMKNSGLNMKFEL